MRVSCRATSEAEKKAWRAQLSRLAHSGHLPCAFVQGAVPGQKTYSFASPRVRLMGASLIEEEQQQSPTQGQAAPAAVEDEEWKEVVVVTASTRLLGYVVQAGRRVTWVSVTRRGR